MKEDIELSAVRSLQRLTEDGTNITRDVTCQLRTSQSRSKKRHRVVFFADHEGHEIQVVTSLCHVSAGATAAMYNAHWGIESFFSLD